MYPHEFSSQSPFLKKTNKKTYFFASALNAADAKRNVREDISLSIIKTNQGHYLDDSSCSVLKKYIDVTNNMLAIG